MYMWKKVTQVTNRMQFYTDYVDAWSLMWCFRTHHPLLKTIPIPADLSSKYEEPPKEEVIAPCPLIQSRGQHYSWIRKLLAGPEHNTFCYLGHSVPSSTR